MHEYLYIDTLYIHIFIYVYITCKYACMNIYKSSIYIHMCMLSND